MSLYEVLVVVALVAVGGYAYHLYRSDVRAPKKPETEAAGDLMFGRKPPKQAGDGNGPEARSQASGEVRK